MDYHLPLGSILYGKSYTYKIEKVLGQGSFGITYLASISISGELGSLGTSIKVAIKEFFMKEINGRVNGTITSGSKGGLYDKYRKKFIKETENLSRLNHPNIVKILESFEANNTVYYVMEYIDGSSLDSLIKEHSKISEHDSIRYIKQIGCAVSYMHEHKMLHLDLKPSNVMVRKTGEVVLIDFGLSKQYTESGLPESSTSVGSGTLGYAPIEQTNYHEGKDFPVTMDVYALGATLFKMLTGKRPPEASEILNNGFPVYELQQTVASDELITCISKAMSPIKKDRYQTINEFLQVLSVLTPLKDYNAEKTEYMIVSSKQPNGSQTVSKLSNSMTKKNRVNSINGHEYVDLGLPSGLMWATCNVGASSPKDFGCLYAWGEIKMEAESNMANWLRSNKKKPSDISGNIEFDVARALWGGAWRMPSKTNFEELRDNCKWEWICLENHKGYIVTGSNGNSIFLPAGDSKNNNIIYKGIGHYWSSTSSVIDDNLKLMKMEFFFKESEYSVRFNTGYSEFSVRPVIDLTEKLQNSDSQINNDTIVAKTPYDQFKQAMTLEGQQKVNTLLDLAKKGNGYTYFPLAEYYFSEGNIPETDKWLAKSLHTVDQIEAKRFIDKKIHEGCINLNQTYETLKRDAFGERDYFLLSEWTKLRGSIKKTVKKETKPIPNKEKSDNWMYLLFAASPVNLIYSNIVYFKFDSSFASLIGLILSIIEIIFFIILWISTEDSKISKISYLLWIFSLIASFVFSSVGILSFILKIVK